MANRFLFKLNLLFFAVCNLISSYLSLDMFFSSSLFFSFTNATLLVVALSWSLTRSLFANEQGLISFSLLLQPSPSQLNQLVQNERAKQQLYLISEHTQAASQAALAAAQAGGYSSAARITASTKQPQAASNVGSRADAPAVIISERERQQQIAAAMMGMKQYSGMTAQAVMESIITQSISGGPPASAEDIKATLAKASQESSDASRSRASQQPPPTSVHDQQQSSSSHKPTLPPDMVLNRELSITPASSVSASSQASMAEDFMKKRQQILITTTAATLTPTSSAPTSRVSDERQITRVAQSVSPAVNKPSSLTVSEAAVASNNALMANAGSSAAAAISAAVAPISVASSVALDLKPRTSDSLTMMRPPSVSEASSKPPMPLPTGTAPPNGEQPPSGMSLCLDYVKNRIVEEMKKHGDDDQPLPGVAQQQQAAIAAGQKRTSPEAASGQSEQDSLANKKAKLDAQVAEAVAAPNNSNANNPPDSPGSPGEMVIDERPDDGPNKMTSSSGHDQSSSGNPSNNSAASSNIEASNKTMMTPVTTAAASNNSNTNASGTSGTTSSGTAQQPPNSSKYEPLSDDE